jgi:endoglucanase
MERMRPMAPMKRLNLFLAFVAFGAGHLVAGEATHPFPQHVAYTKEAIHPGVPQAEMDAAAAAFYDVWKARYFHAGCVPGQAYIFYSREKKQSPKEAIAVSEGHGYGMMLTVLFAGYDPEAQTCFDQLHAYFRAHPSRFTHDLMAWQQMPGCVNAKGDDDSASDGDMDIAYALLLADAQWGSAGKINYRAEAGRVIAGIEAGDVNAAIPCIKLGDWVRPGMPQMNDTRLSDFIPDHFRAFLRETVDIVWSQALEREYAAVAQLQSAHAAQTGLLPDFAQRLDTSAPVPAGRKYLESANDGQYSYNSCRCPWRIGLDYLLTGDPRAKAALAPLNAFIQKKTGGDPARIRAGYFLTGKVIDPDDTSLAFTAPFAVAAMSDSGAQQWLDRLWQKIVHTPAEDDDYYGNSIKLLCLTALSRNYWQP